jgi:hypothetical protein
VALIWPLWRAAATSFALTCHSLNDIDLPAKASIVVPFNRGK